MHSMRPSGTTGYVLNLVFVCLICFPFDRRDFQLLIKPQQIVCFCVICLPIKM